MNIVLHKDNISIVRELRLEQQLNLDNLSLSYEDLKDNYIIAMLLGHKIDELQISISQTENQDAVLALMLAADNLTIIDIENCDSSLNILGQMYPEKLGQLRRAKMLGRSLMEVVM